MYYKRLCTLDITTLQLIFGMPYFLVSWEGEDRARQLPL